MENEDSSTQLLLAQIGTSNVLCVGHITLPCMFLLFHCIVRSENARFILRTRGGLYSHMELGIGKLERQQNIVGVVFLSS